MLRLLLRLWNIRLSETNFSLNSFPYSAILNKTGVWLKFPHWFLIWSETCEVKTSLRRDVCLVRLPRSIRACFFFHNSAAYLIIPIFHVIFKVHVILAESYQIACHPLIGVMPALCRNSCDFHWSTQSDLQILISISYTCYPGSHIAASAWAVESSEVWTVEDIIGRWSSHSSVLDSAVLYANCCSTGSNWKWRFFEVFNTCVQTKLTLLSLQKL